MSSVFSSSSFIKEIGGRSGDQVGSVRYAVTAPTGSYQLSKGGLIVPPYSSRIAPLLTLGFDVFVTNDSAEISATTKFGAIAKAGGWWFASARETVADVCKIYRSATGLPGSWSICSIDTPTAVLPDTFCHLNGVWLVGSSAGNLLLRSTDAGATWATFALTSGFQPTVIDGVFWSGGFNPRVSADGLAWSAPTTNPDSTFSASRIFKVGATYYVFGSNRSMVWSASNVAGPYADSGQDLGNSCSNAFKLGSGKILILTGSDVRLLESGVVSSPTAQSVLFGSSIGRFALVEVDGEVRFANNNFETGVISAAGLAVLPRVAHIRPSATLRTPVPIAGLYDAASVRFITEFHPDDRIYAPKGMLSPACPSVGALNPYMKVR